MLKFFAFLIFAPFLLGFFASDFDKTFRAEPQPTPTPRRPNIVNKPANVESVALDKHETFLPCRAGSYTPEECDKGMTVDVYTKAFDAEDDVLFYKYTISGGKIIGKGANVRWDLSGVRPGTYTIKTEVDDGCGFCGESFTANVEVKECDMCGCDECTCPTISVADPPEDVLHGEIMIFTANVSGGSQGDVTYKWTVKDGTILKGQDTPVIEVFPLTADSVVTATVEIDGLCGSCPTTASATGKVKKN